MWSLDAAGDASTWLGKANAAMYYRADNTTAGGQTTILAFNGAPTISNDSSAWTMNVTLIQREQPTTAQSFRAVTRGAAAASAETVTEQGPVALFIDDLCYSYLFDYWYFCY